MTTSLIWISASLLLMVTLFIIINRWKGMRAARASAVIMFSASLVAGFLLWQQPVEELLVSNRPDPPNPNPEYVTSISCRKCHQEHFRSWYQTYHRTMTRPATAENIHGNFETIQTISGLPVRFFKKEHRFFMETIDPKAEIPEDPTPESVSDLPRVRFPVDRVIGSHISQVYLSLGPVDHPTRDHGVYFTLPYEYSLLDQHWMTSIGSFLQPDPGELWSQASIWNRNCIRCHNVKPRSKPVLSSPYQEFEGDPVELGIACESCHGPGQKHVRANQAPLRRLQFATGAASRDDTILNPAHLNAQQTNAICGRCHSKVGTKDDPELARHMIETGEDPYTPGDELEHWYSLPMPESASPEDKKNLFWPNNSPLAVGLEYQGTITSPCFLNGQEEPRKLDCLSCHSLHQSHPIDQLADKMRTNDACYQCHRDKQADPTAHTHHAANSAGSLCYNCHMPNLVYGLLGVHRTHRIISPNATISAKTGVPNACNQCHLDKTLKWTSDQLNTWYKQPPAALNEHQQNVASAVLMLTQGHAVKRAVTAHAVWRLLSNKVEPGGPSSLDLEPTLSDTVLPVDTLQWTIPFLANALQDDYAAVRLQAQRALKALGITDLENFHFLDLSGSRKQAFEKVLHSWQLKLHADQPPLIPETVPLDPQGGLNSDLLQSLFSTRDLTDIAISE
ncbi:MAG: cytochrome c3 family protein [Planctomycetes bacterium]|nr:cytochrome c3 family protein [Planctomycetota bacterium]